MNSPVFASLIPVILCIGAGFLAARLGWVRAAAIKDLSNLVFLVLTPALLFRTMGAVRVLTTLLLLFLSLTKKLSLIPILGLLSCLYLMTELGVTNWMRFGLWLLVGLLIYALYGYRNSNLSRQTENAEV